MIRSMPTHGLSPSPGPGGRCSLRCVILDMRRAQAVLVYVVPSNTFAPAHTSTVILRPAFPPWQEYQDHYLDLLWPFPLTVMNLVITSLFEDHGGFPAAEWFVRSQVVRDVNMNSAALLQDPIFYIMQLFCIYLNQAAVQTY